jgi:hypothetical protein
MWSSESINRCNKERQMSAIRVYKGFPFSALIRIKDDDTTVNVNDGTWTIEAFLYYQVKNGPKPFDIILTESGSTLLFSLTDEQTSSLSHLGTGYLLVVRASKNDDTIFIENSIPVSVVNGL